MEPASDSLHSDISAVPLPPAAPPAELPPSRSVGVGVLDAQHALILRLTRELHERMSCGEERCSLAAPLHELIRQLRMHFLCEETLMQAFGYPEMLAHQLEHARMDRVLTEFLAQFASSRENIVATFLDYLEGWFVRHIEEHDLAYAGFFVERGAV